MKMRCQTTPRSILLSTMQAQVQFHEADHLWPHLWCDRDRLIQINQGHHHDGLPFQCAGVLPRCTMSSLNLC
jgi:hypothetical protein